MAESTRHILTDFDSALESLRTSVLMMASLTTRNLDNARRGLFERDEDWCNTAIADDEEIDALEIQVDRDGIEIMLRFHPYASDLRSVIAAMKMSVNLERVADQAVGIARRARKLNGRDPLPEVAGLEPLFKHASAMFQDAIRAYAENDPELARTLKPRDRELDEMNRDYANRITELMPKNPDLIHGYLELIFIARFLERIGDQSTNIAEDTVFAVIAEDIRHASPLSR
ncbi:MAG: phosphate signaling complex protein PhoU [Terrimicrobiaceae bacterium]|nr:phosphate signaling complex protein PhoU [Terrimicrobiaceae bacterium]